MIKKLPHIELLTARDLGVELAGHFNKINELVEAVNAIKRQGTSVGALRQWLNEDRITDPKKMVTNEDIEQWLN